MTVHLLHKRRPATSDKTLHEPLTPWNSFIASYSQCTHWARINKYHQPEQYQLAKWCYPFHARTLLLLNSTENTVPPNPSSARSPWQRRAVKTTPAALCSTVRFLAWHLELERKRNSLAAHCTGELTRKVCKPRLLQTFKPAMLCSHCCSKCWTDPLHSTHTHVHSVSHHVLHF